MLIAALMLTILAFPSEDEQLRLIEAADAYYPQSGRDPVGAAERYEEVLQKVDLAEPVKIDIWWRLARIHWSASSGAPDDPHFQRSIELFEAVIADYDAKNLMDNRFLEAHLRLGEVEHLAGHTARAKEHFLYLRTLHLELPPEERAALEPNLSALSEGAMHTLIEFLSGDGRGDAPELRTLRSQVDPEFAVLIDITIERRLLRNEVLLAKNVVTALEQSSPAPSLRNDEGDPKALASLDAAALAYLGRPRSDGVGPNSTGSGNTAGTGAGNAPDAAQNDEKVASGSRVPTAVAVTALVAVTAIALFIWRQRHNRNEGRHRP